MSERESLWPAVLAGWALAAVVLCVALSGKILQLGFHDPDDAMRLLEVRDWLAGQSFWDVSQHRLGGGSVFQMHWSRLVDLPLAAAIGALTPLFGAGAATRAAMTIVPLGQLLLVIALLAHLTRRLTDIATARTAVLIVPITAPLVAQLQPMRIDHHGWQVVFGLAALSALLARPTARSGLLAGLAAGALVTVSLEGLPFAAAIAGVAALAWAFEPARRDQALALCWGLFGGALALHVATRGPNLLAPACDAVAPAWLAVLGVATIGVTLATLLSPKGFGSRLGALSLAGAVAFATLLLLAPACARGPFDTLDPLTRAVWFENIAEGLPIWKQHVVPVLITFSLPIVGLWGATKALGAADAERRATWRMLLALQLIAILLAMMVLRAGATANALAVPGAAVLTMRLLVRARAMPALLPRTLATLRAFAVAAPGLVVAIVIMPLTMGHAATVAQASSRPVCEGGEEVAALARIPTDRFFAPLDISPDILARTSHSAVASGYHRNVVAMHDVLATFLGSPEAARATIARRGAHYVVGCPGLDETEIYKARAPNGFWARLERGERFAWLEPVPMPGSPVRVWKVIG